LTLVLLTTLREFHANAVEHLDREIARLKIKRTSPYPTYSVTDDEDDDEFEKPETKSDGDSHLELRQLSSQTLRVKKAQAKEELVLKAIREGNRTRPSIRAVSGLNLNDTNNALRRLSIKKKVRTNDFGLYEIITDE
jgi:hypothetical protein